MIGIHVQGDACCRDHHRKSIEHVDRTRDQIPSQMRSSRVLCNGDRVVKTYSPTSIHRGVTNSVGPRLKSDLIPSRGVLEAWLSLVPVHNRSLFSAIGISEDLISETLFFFLILQRSMPFSPVRAAKDLRYEEQKCP